MKTRAQFVFWVAAMVVPAILVMSGLIAYIAWEHRASVDARYLERVRAMSIAVDTELEGSIRVLRALSLAPEIDQRHPEAFVERLGRYQSTQPLWTVIALGDPEWKNVVAVGRGGTMARHPAIEPRTLMQIAQTRKPSVSPLIRTDERHYETQVTVPVIRDGAMTAILMVSIDPRAWLELLNEYPSIPGSTMVLLDQDGAIIARTLNHETWVGTRPSGTFRASWRETMEGTNRSKGLEGQTFYSAYSRSSRTGWTLATGIPADSVDEGLDRKLFIAAGAAIVSICIAVLFAFFFARRLEAGA
ncbi:MAG TPA: cache domain-containing protein [Usitatibacter sp.]